MAIQFILGASGTGKTNYIYNEMIQESMTEGHSPIVFLLPEQSNMAAEQDMVSMHPMGGTMEISILSFTRLAFKVFDELHVQTNDILDDYGKSMLLMKLMKENADKLTHYKNMIGKPGFIGEVKSLLSEFYQYQITEETLANAIASLPPEKSLYHKLTDLKFLLHTFDEAMQDSYMVTEQILSQLKEVICESGLLKKAEIYFDGFTGFTPAQYDVIEELMKMGANLYFSVTMDEDIFGNNGYSEQGLFALGKRSVDKLCKLAERNQVMVIPHVGLKDNFRLKENAELLHLERHLFRFPAVVYDDIPENLSLLSAKDSKEEALYIAKTIKEYVMKQGYSYKDFSIVMGDLREQSAIWMQTMKALDIPYFLDYSEVLAHNPIVELVGMVMKLFQTDFSYESVFSLLKTGFLNVEMSRIYDLENYALKYGVRGYGWWNKAFRGKVKGLHDINQTRKEFMDLLGELAKVFRKNTAKTKEYVSALYDFMSTIGMAERLYEKSIFLEEKGKLREAGAYMQAYNKFVLVLDKTMDILGEEELARDDFIEVLLTGISDVRLGVIPSTLDQVVIGDIERTRLHHVKVVFVAGANEGILPKNVSGKGILVDKDRKKLKDMNVVLASDSKEEMFAQQYYLYLQMVQPKQRLVITYRQSDEKGAELRPSYFVKRVQQIFPKLVVRQVESEVYAVLPSTKAELTSEFVRQLAYEDIGDSSIYHAIVQMNDVEVSRILQGYFYNNEAGVLDKAITRRLYGEQMTHSVSRLETYSGCAYKFFLQYGLKLVKREEYTVESSNIGTILHAVMEQFFKKVNHGDISLADVTKEQLEQEAENLVLQAAKEENETIFESSYRNRHQLDVLIRIAKRSIGNLCMHLGCGDMAPTYFEKRFSPDDKLDYIDMALSEGIRMEMNGIIDRVDIKETEDAVYVKIIDYKSGAKDIDYVKMYEGKQLQLTVYMSVMLEMLKREYPDKKIIPTGMYYYHIQDPIIEENDEDKLEQKRIESSRLSGLVNGDETSRELMDGKSGLVTPVKYKKDGELDSRNNALVTTEELTQISHFVREKMIDIGENIVSGKISMNPEKGEHNCPCNFCDYKSVCRFEAGLGGNAYRVGSQMDKKEAKECILNTGDEEREGDNA